MEERICERDKFKSGVKDSESEGGDCDEVNQEESEQDEDDGMEKAGDSTVCCCGPVRRPGIR